MANLVKDFLNDEQNLPISAYELAVAGYELYQAMFDPGAEQARQAKQVRKWLENLAKEESVDSLEVVVECPWCLPLNVIYDRRPDQEAFLANDETPDRWLPFWGLRYNLAGGRRVDPLRRMPVLKEPSILLVVDAEIRAGLPEEQRARLNDFAAKHQLEVIETKSALEKAIRNHRPDLLYWLSHATPDALSLGDEPISPRALRKLLRQDDDEHFGGLAFLNACQTAGSGEAGSFFEALHSVGFAGMIGTEHQTIDQFANPLGLDFLEAFLDGGESVGSALHKLRGRVPLGLLYGTYCPPNIRVDRRQKADHLEVLKVHAAGRSLGRDPALGEADESPSRLPDEPYRALMYYDRDDRALFAGRDDDIERFATFLDDVATRILVLHGQSGVGKSSFVRAGVIPYLEEECLGYRDLRELDGDGSRPSRSPVIFIRGTSDLFGQLARALCEFCVRPYHYRTPLGGRNEVDLPELLRDLMGGDAGQGAVRAALLDDPSLLGRILGVIGDRLPFTPILVIDQGEEVFTLAQTPEDQARGCLALDMLRKVANAPGSFKVVYSLRTEYYGRLIDRLRRGLHDVGGIREYLLTDFDEKSLIEAVRRPTSAEPIPHASEIPFEKYGFRYDEGVAEAVVRRVIRHTALKRDSVLPLVQAICSQLYRDACGRDDRVIRVADLEAIGGVGGALRRHVEHQLDRIAGPLPSEQRAFKGLVAGLYLRQPDGSLTTALLPEDDLAARWRGRTPFDRVLRSAEELRVLRVSSLPVDDEEDRRYVGLGHDALAKLAAQWDDELTRSERYRRLLKKVLAWASAAATVLTAVGLALLAVKRAGDAESSRKSADNVLLARPDAVPFAIQILEPLKVYAMDYLAGRFRDETLPRSQRLHAAYALAKFGRSDRDLTRFLVDGVPRTEAAESINIVSALREDRGRAIGLLRAHWEREIDLVAKVRWATALFSLGATDATRSMLRRGPDPLVRTTFINEYCSWPGDLSSLPDLLEAESDPDFGSGLCSALGKLEMKALSLHDAEALPRALARLHVESTDGAIHGASGWALRSWGLPTPMIATPKSPARGFGWYINSQGMTMLRIPAGTFHMGSPDGYENEQPVHQVRLGSFYLGDREVTLEQFERFVRDEGCPEPHRPREWPGSDKALSPSPHHPAQPVGWADAILFCNWLSGKEGLTPCYVQNGAQEDWEFVPEANGYRLPREAEWEYACRAGTTTEFSCGVDNAFLSSYSVFGESREAMEPCGSRLPNTWGLFDMHGNVMEWCHDRYRDRYDLPDSDLTGTLRVLRGGSALDDSSNLRSARREKTSQGFAARYRTQGFRVARGYD